MKITPDQVLLLGSFASSFRLFQRDEKEKIASNIDAESSLRVVLKSQSGHTALVDFFTDEFIEDIKKLTHNKFRGEGIYLDEIFGYRKNDKQSPISFNVFVKGEKLTVGLTKDVLEKIQTILNDWEYLKVKFWTLNEKTFTESERIQPVYEASRVFNPLFLNAQKNPKDN